jgi:hypothetical protein
MKTLLLSVICCIVFSACTSVTVRRPDANFVIKNVCIQENPKVWVSDFLPVLKDGFARHGIATTVNSGTTKPAGCEYVLTYTALQSWDFVPYLSHAELWLERDGQQIGYAEYHLVGKGGFDLTKWEGTKTKMDPVLDELLGNSSNRISSQQRRNQEEPPIIEKGKPAEIQQSKSQTNPGFAPESSSFSRKKFFADLSLYDGPIVGSNQITRAEFVETTDGSGTVRLIAPGNKLFNGTFHSEPVETQKLTVLSSRTRNTIKLLNDGNAGVLVANDDYGTRLECVYGTLASSGGPGGVCGDTRGNKYKLFFDK